MYALNKQIGTKKVKVTFPLQTRAIYNDSPSMGQFPIKKKQ